MRRVTAWFAVLLFAVGALGQEKSPPEESPKPIGELAWLIGGVWTADASKMGGGIQRIETRYEWSDNRSFVRFNTHFVTDKSTLHNYDGQFYWDRQQNALKMWYMDAHNSITQGSITAQGDVFDFAFQASDSPGKVVDYKVQVVRKNKDRYTWELAMKVPEGWKTLGSLEYVRTS